jgi:hypothetical protein
MTEITEREIVEAAKALCDFEGSLWDGLQPQFKWLYLEYAYAALRAARKVRG